MRLIENNEAEYSREGGENEVEDGIEEHGQWEWPTLRPARRTRHTVFTHLGYRMNETALAGLHPIAGIRAPVYRRRMNTKTFRPAKLIGLALFAAFLPLLFGCVEGPGRTRVRVQTPSVYVQTEVIAEDDYVYYPGYEVYYSSNRRQYMYRDGRNWVTRPAPPRVSLDILLASPSVRVDFHDSPAQHHEQVIRSYPKNWRPAGDRSDRKSKERHDNRNDGRKGDKDDDNRKRD